MSLLETRRSNFSVQAIIQILNEEGLDASHCLEGTGLVSADILRSDTKISDAEEIAILERALTQLPEKAGYGIRAGKSLQITTFGAWGLALNASASFRDAFEMISRYSELSFLLINIELEERNREAKIIANMVGLPQVIHRFVFERFYASAMWLIHGMLPSLDRSQFELHLPFKDPAYEQGLAELTGRKVHAGQGSFALISGREWLDEPLPNADPLANGMFTQKLEALRRSQQELPDHARLVRDNLMQSGNFSMSLDKIATEAGLSARTLRRRLQEEGTSFNEILTSSRMQTAKQLLSVEGLSVSATAFKIGYSEVASFSRAYARWWGESPSKTATRCSAK